MVGEVEAEEGCPVAAGASLGHRKRSLAGAAFGHG